MSARLLERESVVADTSLFCNVLRALPFAALASVLNYLDCRLTIVTDVAREMNGLAQGSFADLAALKTVEMVGEYVRQPPLALDVDLAALVEPIALHNPIFTPDPEKPRKNWGEIATVLAAARARAPVLIDDRDGRRFAQVRKVEVFTTRDLVAEMCADGALAHEDGFAVWRVAAKRHPDRPAFDSAVELRRR